MGCRDEMGVALGVRSLVRLLWCLYLVPRLCQVMVLLHVHHLRFFIAFLLLHASVSPSRRLLRGYEGQGKAFFRKATSVLVSRFCGRLSFLGPYFRRFERPSNPPCLPICV